MLTVKSITMTVEIVSPGDDACDRRMLAAAHLSDGRAWISLPDDPDAEVEPDAESVVEMSPGRDRSATPTIRAGLESIGWRVA